MRVPVGSRHILLYANLPCISVCVVEITQSSLGRIRKTPETPPRVSVYDVLSVITGLSTNNCSNVWKRLQDDFPEIALETGPYSFKGQGQRETPVCTEEVLKHIVALLPGKSAALARATGRVAPARPSSTDASDMYMIRSSIIV